MQKLVMKITLFYTLRFQFSIQEHHNTTDIHLDYIGSIVIHTTFSCIHYQIVTYSAHKEKRGRSWCDIIWAGASLAGVTSNGLDLRPIYL